MNARNENTIGWMLIVGVGMTLSGVPITILLAFGGGLGAALGPIIFAGGLA